DGNGGPNGMRLHRGRVAIASYALGAAIGWWTQSFLVGAAILVAGLAVHFGAYRVEARRTARRQKSSLDRLRNRGEVAAQEFYRGSARRVPLVNPPAEREEEAGRRALSNVGPSDYLRKRTLRQTLEPVPCGGRLLDIGCRVGDVSVEFADAGFSLFLTDLDQASLLRAMERTKSRGVIADVERLPFKGNAFAGIGFLEVIEHLDSPKNALLEIRRVLAPRGRLFLSTDNRSCVLPIHLLNPLIVLERLAGPVSSAVLPPRAVAWEGSVRPVLFPHTNFSWPELAMLLKDAGFQIRAASTYYYLPGTHRLIARWKPGLTEAEYAEPALKAERFLRRIPGVRKLGSHWWIQAEGGETS
ncbi:MAG: class I SAM-dependent methyltransferase, partial [Nitrospinota bacterium]